MMISQKKHTTTRRQNMNNRIILSAPSYIHKGANSTSSISLKDELLSRRIILITGEISDETAVNAFMSFGYLTQSPEPIKIVINSGGGEVIAGQAIYDIMQGIKNEVHTFCLGGNDVQTAKAVSERCDKPLNEVLYMPVGHCWVFRRGSKPRYAKLSEVCEIDKTKEK